MARVRSGGPPARYDPWGRRGPVRSAPAAPSGAVPRGNKGYSSTDHILPKMLFEVPRYTQVMGVTVPRKVVSCEQARCTWFLFGQEGLDEEKPFRHPVGVECGDFAGCPDPNCPCPRNLVREMQNGVPTGVVGHLVPDHDQGPTWRVSAGQGLQTAGIDEIVERTGAGVEAIVGLQDMVANGAGEYRVLA